jgi:ATP-dependent protease ClpP protease subunit
MFNKIINQYITAKSDGNIGEIYIWGDITSMKWWDEDVTPQDIKKALNEMGDVTKVKVSVNSYGGECDAGILIYNILDDYRKRKNISIDVTIDGVAASMGGVIAMVGDKVTMHDNAILMLHKPMGVALGNSDEMRKQADVLDKYEQRLINIFMSRFKGTEDELKEIISAETWYLADEAKERGFVDEVIPTPLKAVASAKGIVVNDVEFGRDILDKIKDKIKITESEDDVKDVLIYDVKLAEFGISEEDFKALTSVNDLVDRVVERAREGFVPEQSFANVKAELEAKKADYKNLSDKFEAVRQEAIENAIKNGVRANDKFDEVKWRKRLSNMEYDEIRDISDEWFENAKAALKAGVRITAKTEGEKNIDPLTGKSLAF